MEHFYKDIYGFCDYVGFYKKVVNFTIINGSPARTVFSLMNPAKGLGLQQIVYSICFSDLSSLT